MDGIGEVCAMTAGSSLFSGVDVGGGVELVVSVGSGVIVFVGVGVAFWEGDGVVVVSGEGVTVGFWP